MACLAVEGHDLVVRLNPVEKVGALHGSIRVPLTNVIAVEPSNAVWHELRGLRMPGTGFPGVIALGTWRYRGGKDFVAVYRRTGLVIRLADSEWDRLVVSSRVPHRVCQEINASR
ncbi:MAG: hypothetical protein JO296_02735 [Pseudonocardiales bacterium]|jgi:hypothetical protein|nr:hypothetical protein [Pseudonocardiales bacterium]MBV9649040.1 hypothetical protein [Pseudonocardiales bacterium]